MGGALSVAAYNLVVYRRTWRGSLLVSFVSPVLFLAAIGIGLGNLVGRSTGLVDGVSYLHFIAPGLLAATAMQTAGIEMSYPIMGKVMWMRIYEAMLSTPLRVRDVLAGELAWLSARLAMVAVVYCLVMAAFGVVQSPLVVLAVPVAVLVGLAFGAPILAFAATQVRDSGFAAINRFVILPLFLLSGAFFPIDRLPQIAQVVAWLTPLAHGAALVRSLTLGGGSPAAGLLHVAVLLVYITAGVVAADWAMRRRLVT